MGRRTGWVRSCCLGSHGRTGRFASAGQCETRSRCGGRLWLPSRDALRNISSQRGLSTSEKLTLLPRTREGTTLATLRHPERSEGSRSGECRGLATTDSSQAQNDGGEGGAGLATSSTTRSPLPRTGDSPSGGGGAQRQRGRGWG